MPVVDPESGQMLSDDPEQEDEDLAGGNTGGGFQHDHTDTGHHSAVDESPGGNDEGPHAPSEVEGDDPGGEGGTSSG